MSLVFTKQIFSLLIIQQSSFHFVDSKIYHLFLQHKVNALPHPLTRWFWAIKYCVLVHAVIFSQICSSPPFFLTNMSYCLFTYTLFQLTSSSYPLVPDVRHRVASKVTSWLVLCLQQILWPKPNQFIKQTHRCELKGVLPGSSSPGWIIAL